VKEISIQASVVEGSLSDQEGSIELAEAVQAASTDQQVGVQDATATAQPPAGSSASSSASSSAAARMTARRWGLVLAPPKIVLEYQRPDNGQLRVRALHLRGLTAAHAASEVASAVAAHLPSLANGTRRACVAQLCRLVQRLQQGQAAAPAPLAAAGSAQPPVTPGSSSSAGLVGKGCLAGPLPPQEDGEPSSPPASANDSPPSVGVYEEDFELSDISNADDSSLSATPWSQLTTPTQAQNEARRKIFIGEQGTTPKVRLIEFPRTPTGRTHIPQHALLRWSGVGRAFLLRRPARVGWSTLIFAGRA
jgi:hypothetical protein